MESMLGKYLPTERLIDVDTKFSFKTIRLYINFVLTGYYRH